MRAAKEDQEIHHRAQMAGKKVGVRLKHAPLKSMKRKMENGFNPAIHKGNTEERFVDTLHYIELEREKQDDWEAELEVRGEHHGQLPPEFKIEQEKKRKARDAKRKRGEDRKSVV